MVYSNHRRFRDTGMLHEYALKFSRPDTVAGHIDHIINPAEDPEISVAILSCPVPGKVFPGPLGPIGLFISFLIPVNTAQHPRPGITNRKYPCLNFFALFG